MTDRQKIILLLIALIVALAVAGTMVFKHSTEIQIKDEMNVYQGTGSILKATIVDEDGNPIEGTVPVRVKINNKTVAKGNATDGIIRIKLKTQGYKQGEYNLTIKTGENFRNHKTTREIKLKINPPMENTTDNETASNK